MITEQYKRISGHNNNPRSDYRGRVSRSILVVEKVIGKFLSPAAVVHHINKIRHDDRNENFVVCENKNYHELIHLRSSALRCAGNPAARFCSLCSCWDYPEEMVKRSNGYEHDLCRKIYANRYYQKNKEKILRRMRSRYGNRNRRCQVSKDVI